MLVGVPLALAQEHPGKTAYGKVCLACHGLEGRGDLAPTLAPMAYDADYVLAIVPRRLWADAPNLGTGAL